MTMFTVKFINLTENTIEFQGDYDSLMDALRVCKETNMSSHYHRPAMSNEKFNECLLELLITGMVYTGTITEEFPDGEIMIDLHRDGAPVYSALPMPREAADIVYFKTYEAAEEALLKKPRLIQELFTKQRKSFLEDEPREDGMFHTRMRFVGEMDNDD